MDEDKSSRPNKNSKKSNRLGNWFSSLTRRKKKDDCQQQQQQNNNVEFGTSNQRAGSDSNLKQITNQSYNSSSSSHHHKKEDQGNVFHKFNLKFSLRPPLSTSTTHAHQISESSQSNASSNIENNLNFETSQSAASPSPSPFEKFTNIHEIDNKDDPDSEKPFTHLYRRHINKKWLEQNSGPNLIMYRACNEMINHVWYWGETKKQDAQKQLTGKPNGSFLVRDSESEGSQFTLSFRICNYTFHYRLQYRDNYWHFEECLKFNSIVEMIEDIMSRSTDEHFVCYVRAHNVMQPPIPVYLRYPISRYVNIPSLQDLCRRSIHRFDLNLEQIENLPIPTKLQQYLTEKNSLLIF